MQTYKVTAKSGLHIRSSPNGKIKTTVPYGTKLESDGKKQGGWTHVNHGGWGWAYTEYLKKESSQKKTVVKIATKKRSTNQKNKTKTDKKIVTKSKTKSKSKPISNGKIGCWGKDLVFEVNSNKIFQPRDIGRTQDGRWEKHNVVNKVPKSEFLGPDETSITMTITLSAEHGIRPRHMIGVIEKAIRSGKIEYLVIGGKVTGHGKMKIEKASETWNTIYNKGELVRANVDLTFVEYG